MCVYNQLARDANMLLQFNDCESCYDAVCVNAFRAG